MLFDKGWWKNFRKQDVCEKATCEKMKFLSNIWKAWRAHIGALKQKVVTDQKFDSEVFTYFDSMEQDLLNLLSQNVVYAA